MRVLVGSWLLSPPAQQTKEITHAIQTEAVQNSVTFYARACWQLVALFSAVLSRTCKECLRSQSEERYDIVGGARTVHVCL